MALDHLTRRGFTGLLGGAALLAVWPAGASLARNPSGERLHGLSPFGDLKYPKDYRHFDWVRLDAPKGGRLDFSVPNWAFNQNVQTFDTLNSFVLRGSSPPRMEHCFDALMVGAADTPGELYCALAESVEIAADRNTYTFRLRPEARFHDGTPVTAADVAWSFATLKSEGHPGLQVPMRDLKEAVADDERTVRLVFDGNQSDRAVLTLAAYPVFQRLWFEGRDFDAVGLDAPMGSGPWRVKRLEPARFIEYERVADWWAADMPWARGLWNFDTCRIEFFRDRTAAFEAFKKGKVRFREEFTSKRWKTEYDFGAVEDGRVVTKLFAAEPVPAMQAWALNARLPQFADAATRKAIGLAFDFEWTNRNLFFDAYARAQSLFEKSEFRAEGEPTAAELTLMEPLREHIPDEAFGAAVAQPITDGSGRDRKRLREAARLLSEAGWERKGGRLFRAGKPLDIEFLIRSPSLEKLHGKFVQNLNALGANASIRLVDASQYQRRLDTFDFQATMFAASFGATPTAETLRNTFSSRVADRQGSRNYAYVKNDAVDALVVAVGKAETREEMAVAMCALDRTLRALHAWIPCWYSPHYRVAYWDMFGYPEPKPEYGFPVEAYWHIDRDKAAKIEG